MRFPTISDVATKLRRINKQDSGDEEGIDVRLQVHTDGTWTVNWGLSDYDQDHRGFWGSSIVPGDNRRFDSKDIARDLIEQAREQKATGGDEDEGVEVESSGMRERAGGHRMRSRRQPSLPGFPDIPEKLEIQIPDMPMWEQIDGDMDPGAYGGTIAKSDGDAIELLKIQPVREYVGDKEAADVGHPFWTREAYFTLEDLDPNDKDVKSALDSIGMEHDQLEELTPTQRALTIASALLDYGKADEGPAGWSDDIIHDKVKWHSGKVAGAEYIADEDEAYAQDVLLGDFEVDYEKYGPDEKEPTSGLKVAVSNGNVEIVEWTDIVDATGEDQPEGEEVTRQSADVALSELLDPKGKHRGTYSGDNKTVSIVELAKMDSDEEREEAVVAAAIAYLGYYGGTEEFVDQIGD